MKVSLLVNLLNAGVCGGFQVVPTNETTTMETGTYRVWIKSATIDPRRPDGSPWHLTQPDSTAMILGSAAGVAVGNPEFGTSVGAAFADKGGDPEAPSPYIAIKIAGQTETIAPVGRSYSPTWDQSFVINTMWTSPNERVVIQV